MSESIEKIKEQINRPRSDIPDLIINRLPDKTKKQFVSFAHDEFCGDYGFAFKHIFDFYFGLVPKGTEHIEMEVEAIKDEITRMKELLVQSQQEPSQGRRMMNGKTIR